MEELLKAASAPASDPRCPQILDADIEYLVSGSSDVHFQSLERYESLDPESELEPKGLDRFVPLPIFGVLGAGLLLAFVGLFTILSWTF